MRDLSEIVSLQRPAIMAETASVREACQCMAERRIGSVLVTDQTGRLVGIFTGRDAVSRVIAAGRSPARTRLCAVMTANPLTMTSRQSAIDALRLMWDGGFRHIPVVDDGVIRGIVSRGDFRADENERIENERTIWEQLR